MMPRDVVLIKQARRQIMTSLNIVYPAALQAATLNRSVIAVIPTYDIDLLAKDVHYLIAKGYLAEVDQLIGGSEEFRFRTYTLTARGKEIADKVDFDPMLEV